MSAERSAAYRMRMKGFSYNEINKALGVSKSTLSLWFKDVILSDAARARIASRRRIGSEVLIQRNKLQTHRARRRAADIREAACAQVPAISGDELLLAGAILYWAEGYKRPVMRRGVERTSHRISFLNSDPEAIRVFVRFLIEVLDVPKPRILATMRLYQHINEEEAMQFWRKASSLERASFRRTTYLVSGASKGKRPYNRLPYGTLEIGVNDTEKFHQVMGYIEGVKRGGRCARMRISPR